MNHFVITVFVIGLLGVLTGLVGLLIGGLFASIINLDAVRTKGFILGLLGGVTLGIVFFDLLPEAIEVGSIFISVCGALMGLCLAVLLDGRLEVHNAVNMDKKYNSYMKTAIFMAIGIALHNLPSGLALGSLLKDSPENGMYLAIALILDGIPEGLTLGVFFKESKTSKVQFLLTTLLIAAPLGVGASIGCVFSSPLLICISLSFASAMILYVTLRETLPTANDMWKGRLTTIGNVLGIILGILFISML